MKWSRVMAAVCAALLGLAVMAAADEKADKAIKELDQRFAKVNSYMAEMLMTTDIDYGSGHTETSEMVVTTEWVRKAKKALMRTETKSDTTKTEEGKTTKETSTTLTVSDGDFSYSMFDHDGQKMVMKSRAQPAQAAHPRTLFAQLRMYNNISLLPDEKVAGEDCYVFELKAKSTEGESPTGRSVMYYQKSSGISVKSQGFDANGKLTSTSTTTELKINVDISADRFKFQVPEGAQVTDMTGAGQPPAQAESETEQPEKEQPKKEESQKPEKGKRPKLPKRPELP